MAKPALAPWRVGSINYTGEKGAWTARARLGTPNGTKDVTGRGTSKTAAKTSLEQNVEARRRRHEEGDRQRGRDARMPLGDYALAWHARESENGTWSGRTPDTYMARIKALQALPAASIPIGEVTTGDVRDALTTTARERGAQTARNMRAVLSGVLADATERGVLERNPVRDIDMKRVTANARKHVPVKDSKKSLSAEQLATLLKDLQDPDTAVGAAARGKYRTVNADMPDLLTVWVALALRVSEVVSLRWEDVDLEARTVTVRGTKTDESEATLPLAKWAAKVLAERPRRGVYVFPGRTGGPRDTGAVNKRLNAVLRAAGVPWARGHTLRKTAVTLTYETDGPLAAQQLARHANLRTTQQFYVMATEEPLTISALDSLDLDQTA